LVGIVFGFRDRPNAVSLSMGFRSTGLVIALSLTLLGCAGNDYGSRAALVVQHVFRDQNNDRMWRLQKERQQRIAREAGRIGYIGNAGPALGTSFSSSTF
jgi:hypothetical protein